MTRSSVCTVASFSHNADFLSDVDSRRTPSNATAAAGASGTPELIDPGGKLVRHPLAIAGLAGSANAATVNVRKTQREARVPAAPALGMVTGHIGDVFHRGAETSGTNHGAIGAAQTPGCDFVPLRAFKILIEQFLETGSVNFANLIVGCGFDCRFRIVEIGVFGRSGFKFGKYLRSAFAAGFDQESVGA